MSEPVILGILRYMAKPDGYLLAEEVLEAVSVLYPPALTGEIELKLTAPAIQHMARLASTGLAAGLLDGSLVADGRGGIVTKAWADDPRHQLNPNGTFRY